MQQAFGAINPSPQYKLYRIKPLDVLWVLERIAQ